MQAHSLSRRLTGFRPNFTSSIGFSFAPRCASARSYGPDGSDSRARSQWPNDGDWASIDNIFRLDQAGKIVEHFSLDQVLEKLQQRGGSGK
jgi:hypothetical protein